MHRHEVNVEYLNSFFGHSSYHFAVYFNLMLSLLSLLDSLSHMTKQLSVLVLFADEFHLQNEIQ